MFENLTGTHKPDILDCISNLSSDEVFTPPKIVGQILDLLPSEVWKNKDLKFLDPACKSGVFLREIAKRLMSGLEDAIPNEEDRRDHIFHNMLYGIAITELTGLIARRSLYYSKSAISDRAVTKFSSDQGNIKFERGSHTYIRGKCKFCGSPENSLERGEHLENYAYQFIHNEKALDMKFDVIIGNPPYQLESGGFGAQATPIYHLFVETALKLNPRYMSFIIPARWFAGGMGLDSFRQKMLAEKRIKTLVDYPDSTECFPGVDIAGGICYFLWDANYSGDVNFISIQGGNKSETERSLGANDVLVRHNGAISILEKVSKFKEKTLFEQVSSVSPFNMSTNFSDYSANGSITVHTRNFETHKISKAKITKNVEWIDKFKVLVSQAYGERGSYPFLITGKPFVVEPPSVCTATYLVIATSSSKKTAESIQEYLKTRFCRFLISLRKNTQHLNADRFKFVPEQDWKQKWTDDLLYKKYNLTKDEIEFIHSMIREMP